MSLRSTLEELKDFDTPLLANTIGYIDPTPAHEYYMGGAIKLATPGLGPTVGVAFTCEIDTSSPGGQLAFDDYFRQLDKMRQCREPAVWVVKTVGSRPDHECVLGDGMAKDLYSCGCIGVVTGGGVRDIDGLLSIPFAAYARGTTVHHAAMRVRSIDRPIEVGGIQVHPGDIIHANAEGVIKIPTACLDKLSDNARRMRTFEYEAHAILRRSDLPSLEKRKQVLALVPKYHFGE